MIKSRRLALRMITRRAKRLVCAVSLGAVGLGAGLSCGDRGVDPGTSQGVQTDEIAPVGAFKVALQVPDRVADQIARVEY